MLLYAWHEFLLAQMVQLAQIKIKKVLWDKNIAKFQENYNGGAQDGGGVYDRWKSINKACTLWKGSLERAMISRTLSPHPSCKTLASVKIISSLHYRDEKNF